MPACIVQVLREAALWGGTETVKRAIASMVLPRRVRVVCLLLLCVTASHAAGQPTDDDADGPVIRLETMLSEEAAFEAAFENDPVAAGKELSLWSIPVCQMAPSKVLMDAISFDAIQLSVAGRASARRAQNMIMIPLSESEHTRHCTWASKMIAKAEEMIKDLHAPKSGLGQD